MQKEILTQLKNVPFSKKSAAIVLIQKFFDGIFPDHYSLDGADSNGFVGCMWSICGIHDQGWAERPIFGKIRFSKITILCLYPLVSVTLKPIQSRVCNDLNLTEIITSTQNDEYWTPLLNAEHKECLQKRFTQVIFFLGS